MHRSDLCHPALFWILYGGQWQPALPGVALRAEKVHIHFHVASDSVHTDASTPIRFSHLLDHAAMLLCILRHAFHSLSDTDHRFVQTLQVIKQQHCCVFLSHHAHDYFKPTGNHLGFCRKCSFNSLKDLGISFTGRSANDTFFNYSFSSCHNAWPIPSPEFRFLPLLYSLLPPWELQFLEFHFSGFQPLGL